jgi:hypothetical protein
MISLPINVINLICEWAAQEDVEWYPFFSPKDHKVSWKVNKYSKKFIERADIIMRNKFTNPVFYGIVTLFNISNQSIYFSSYKAVFLEVYGGRPPACKLYIEFDSETNIENQNKFMFRSQVDFNIFLNEEHVFQTLLRDFTLYLNTTPYGLIKYSHFNNETFEMSMTIELF